MTEKTEALRLAAELSKSHLNHHVNHAAAAELRRLHASCEDYAQHKQRQDQRVLELAERVLELKAQRDALLEALRIAEAALSDIGDADREPGDDVAWCEARAAEAIPQARAAIKAVEENT